ncbi:hypothetical protein MJ904_02290 [Massilia sp. MB5]|uniref:hypothetical protein n=1 Tax=unclassified Massilia TaxID=2609279 RepID=UPI00067BF93D|nr:MULTISPECIES: hypothetical protein [unclassified Massilia]AKU23944.1 hypothetical protein ACZ75_23260 [Massilia sp. NR 4-1]UMR31107.1 hypothetical protein MJ904_02290 [Massilia sp. MB5]
MTASYQHLALADVQPGMILSDELLDVQGHVLLPQGTVLTEAMIALMPRHGIATLPIRLDGPSAAEEAASRQHHEARLNHLFRRHDPDAPQDWARGVLRRFVADFRLGMEPAP